jgi:hypothetical protein
MKEEMDKDIELRRRCWIEDRNVAIRCCGCVLIQQRRRGRKDLEGRPRDQLLAQRLLPRHLCRFIRRHTAPSTVVGVVPQNTINYAYYVAKYNSGPASGDCTRGQWHCIKPTSAEQYKLHLHVNKEKTVV